MLDIPSRFVRGFAPADRRDLDDWARDNIKVGAWSPWEGRFGTDRTPWIVTPLRILGRPGPRRATILGPAAGSKSTISEVFVAWVVDNAPGFTCWFAQDEDAAKEFAETRIQRFLASCEAVSKWFPPNRHARRTQAIHFPHMSFLIQSANEGNAQSKHIRHLICDEPWLYPPGMLAALHKRTNRFAHNRTIIETSTGSLEGDEVDQAFKEGTRQEWQLHCPKCGGHHVPRWTFGRADAPGGVKWDARAKRADGTWDLRLVVSSTYYECPACRAQYPANSANGYALNKGGKYTEPASDAVPGHWSFHWNCIASDFAQLGAIAVEFIKAKAAIKRGTTALLQEFTQKRLAEAWKDEPVELAVAEIASDYNLGDPWPAEAIRLMVVDVQLNHFWVIIRSFSKDGQTRLVSASRLESWDSVAAFQAENGIPDNCVVVDSGDATDAVYTACCKWGWFAIKGEKVPGGYLVQRPDAAAIRVIARYSADINGRKTEFYPTQLAPGSKLRCCKMMLVSDEMTSEVMLKARGGRLAGWTIAKNAPDFYLAQLASTVRVSRPHPTTNAPIWEWKEIGNAGNHLWDCERYAIAAAFLAGYFFQAENQTPPKPQPVPVT